MNTSNSALSSELRAQNATRIIDPVKEAKAKQWLADFEVAHGRKPTIMDTKEMIEAAKRGGFLYEDSVK